MSDRTEIEIPATGLLPETQVEEQAAPAEGERQLSPRELAMQRIYENADRQREAELARGDVLGREAHDNGLDFNPDEDFQPSAGQDRQQPVEAKSEPAQGRDSAANTSMAATAVAPAPVPTSPQTFAVEVDGQQLHVTQDQLVYLARMGVIANQALHSYQTQQQTPQPQHQPEPARPIVDENRIRETVKRIQYGNEDDATTALASLISDVRVPQAPPVDHIAIANYAANVASHRARLETDTQTIQREYADIFENAIRSNAAAQQVNAIRQRNVSLGQTQSDLDIYREAGNRVRDAFGLIAPRPDAQSEQPVSQAASPNIVVRSRGDVERRKREAPRSTSQVIDRRSQAPEAPRPPSGADVVELMRKQRGQSSMR